MDEAALRAAIRELGRQTFGTPDGRVRVPPEALADRWFDLAEVETWVEAQWS